VATDRIVTIGDQTGSTARINVDAGFNCFSFAPVTESGPLEVLWAAPGFDRTSPPSLSGTPILFPFGGRLRDRSFRWQGREYLVTRSMLEGGMAIHGFVLHRSWRVIEQSDSRVVGEFQASVDDPALLDEWPADFQIRVGYEVRGRSLISEIELHNPSDAPSPYGFATHGYFRLPIGGSDPEACIVTVPAEATWLLGPDYLPTGEILPVTTENDLRSGKTLADSRFDSVYTQVNPEADGTVQASICDPESGRMIRVISTGPFREFVLYVPAHREAIAIEPYTCCPTTFDLEERGFDAGLRILQPGQTESLKVEVRLEETGESPGSS
jgi:aldose 1-epimerase